MKKIHPYKIARWLRNLRYKNTYLHTVVKSFLIGISCAIGVLFGAIPLALGPDGIFLYLIIAPLLIGYAHFVIDCFDY